MKIALWIHTATQAIAVGVFQYYLSYFHDHLLYDYGIKPPYPGLIDLLFRFHLALWLLPLAALLFALWADKHPTVNPGHYAIFSAASALSLVALVALATLGSVSPSAYPIKVIKGP